MSPLVFIPKSVYNNCNMKTLAGTIKPTTKSPKVSICACQRMGWRGFIYERVVQ